MLFFSGLSFLGHVARRVAGPGQGYLVTGMLGGLVSSTNVTFTFGRLSRNERAMERALAFGAVGANAVLYPRVLLATAVLQPALAPALIPYLAMPALIGALGALSGLRKSSSAGRMAASAAPPAQNNPLQLHAAIQLAVLFQGVLMLVYLAREMWGSSGVLASAAVLGLTDVDALTVSMARGVATTASLNAAALGIAVGVLANTSLKLGVALVFGSGCFRKVVGGTLAFMAVAAAAALVWL